MNLLTLTVRSYSLIETETDTETDTEKMATVPNGIMV